VTGDEAPEASRPPRRRVRRWAALGVVVLATMSVLAAGLGVWVDRTLFDSDRFASAVGRVAEDPAVVQAMGTYLTEHALLLLDAEDRVAELLPGDLSRLAPVLVGALAGAAAQEVEELLASAPAQDLIVALAREAHAAVMALLESDGLFGDGVSIEEGTVTVNLLPLLDDVLRGIQSRGILPARVQVPTLADGGQPSEQVEELANALEVQLPPDFGQVVVYQSDRLAEGQSALANAQRAVALFKRALVLLLVAVVVLVGLALLVSVNRWRTLAQLGLGTALAMVLAVVVVRRVVSAFIDEALHPDAQAVTRSFLGDLTSGLRTLAWVLIAVGVVIAVVGFLAGRSEAARSLRGWAGGAARPADRGEGAMAGHGLAAHADAVRVGVLVLAAAALFIGGFTWVTLVVVGLVLAIGLGGVELLRRSPGAAPV
jgi:hypothetical protein